MSNVIPFHEREQSFTSIQIHNDRQVEIFVSKFLDDEDSEHIRNFVASFKHLLKPQHKYSLFDLANLIEANYCIQNPKIAEAVRVLKLCHKVTDLHLKQVVNYIKRDNLKGCLDYFYTLNGDLFYKVAFSCGFSFRQFAKSHKAILRDIQSELLLSFTKKVLPIADTAKNPIAYFF